MANMDRPAPGQPTIRITGTHAYGYTVEEWLGNQFWGAWHAMSCRFEQRHQAEAEMKRLAKSI